MRIPRVLRSLKFAYTYKKMKGFFECFIESIKRLFNVFLFLTFIIFLFSCIGLHEYGGDLYSRCRFTEQPINGVWQIDVEIERFCNAFGQGDYDCPHGLYCGNPSMYDLSLNNENYTDNEKAGYGLINFDNAATSMLTSFTVITLDGWVEAMYNFEDSDGTISARIFFPSLVFIGAFFALNLIVAEIVETFQHLREQEVKLLDSIEDVDDIVNDNNENVGDQINSSVRPIWTQKASMKPIEELIDEDSCCSSLKRCCILISRNIIFKGFILLSIIGNLAVLSVNRYLISRSETEALDYVDIYFFSIFWVEMIIRFIGYGASVFLSDKYNLYDCFSNILGIAEVCLTFSPYSYGNSFIYLLDRLLC